MSGLDRIASPATGHFGGLDIQAHFLPQGAAEEGADAVGLPLSSGDELLHRRTVGPLQKFQNPASFATSAGCGGVWDAAGRLLDFAF